MIMYHFENDCIQACTLFLCYEVRMVEGSFLVSTLLTQTSSKPKIYLNCFDNQRAFDIKRLPKNKKM